MTRMSLTVLSVGLLAVALRGQGRDPFAPPPAPPAAAAAAPAARPAGLAGVALNELRIEGVALGGPTGAVALAAGPRQEVYFLRPGARLWDATVTRLDANGVWFTTREGATVYRKISG